MNGTAFPACRLWNDRIRGSRIVSMVSVDRLFLLFFRLRCRLPKWHRKGTRHRLTHTRFESRRCLLKILILVLYTLYTHRFQHFYTFTNHRFHRWNVGRRRGPFEGIERRLKAILAHLRSKYNPLVNHHLNICDAK